MPKVATDRPKPNVKKCVHRPSFETGMLGLKVKTGRTKLMVETSWPKTKVEMGLVESSKLTPIEIRPSMPRSKFN